MRARGGTALALVVVGLAGCTGEPTDTAEETGSQTADRVAEQLMQVTSAHEATGGTLLEGPTIGEDGKLYVVDVMAPAGEPKVMRIDRETQEIETVFTDETSALTSAQFSPVDGRLYATDYRGSILSMTADGADMRTEFSGEIEGQVMQADDLTFGSDGTMYVTDTTGSLGPGWETPGRVVRISNEGEASVLASDLPSPNGIVFDEDEAGLYVAQYNANRIDYMALDETGETVTAAHPAIYVSPGRARIDSTAVDSAGNIYQAFHHATRIEVYSPDGSELATITVPESEAAGLDSATNIAIEPGTTDGYITISGEDGGMIYTFDALAEGSLHSNGG